MYKMLNLVVVVILVVMAIFAVKTVKERREEARLRETVAAISAPHSPIKTSAPEPEWEEVEIAPEVKVGRPKVTIRDYHNAIPDYTKVDKVVDRDGNFLGIAAKKLETEDKDEIGIAEQIRRNQIVNAAQDAVPDEKGMIKAVEMKTYVMVHPKGEAPFFISNKMEDPGDFLTRIFTNPESPQGLVEIPLGKIFYSPEGEHVYCPVVFSKDEDGDGNLDAGWYCFLHGVDLEKLAESVK